MHSDLMIVCTQARQAIAVPAVPLDAIRNAARFAQSKPKRRWLPATLVASLSLAAVCIAAATATHIAFTRNGGIVLSGAMTMRWNVTAAEAEAAAQRDGLMLPAGLPDGTRLSGMMDYGDTLALSYDLPGAWRRDNHLLWMVVTRAQPKGSAAPFPSTVEYAHKGRLIAFFKTGDERVYIDAPSTMTNAELAGVKAAMNGQ